MSAVEDAVAAELFRAVRTSFPSMHGAWAVAERAARLDGAAAGEGAALEGKALRAFHRELRNAAAERIAGLETEVQLLCDDNSEESAQSAESALASSEGSGAAEDEVRAATMQQRLATIDFLRRIRIEAKALIAGSLGRGGKSQRGGVAEGRRGFWV